MINKETKRGKYTLTHERYIDYFGLEKDSFDLFNTKTRTHYPFFGLLKASDFGKDSPIGKIPYDYTEQDYEKMLDEEIARLSP